MRETSLLAILILPLPGKVRVCAQAGSKRCHELVLVARPANPLLQLLRRIRRLAEALGPFVWMRDKGRELVETSSSYEEFGGEDQNIAGNLAASLGVVVEDALEREQLVLEVPRLRCVAVGIQLVHRSQHVFPGF